MPSVEVNSVRKDQTGTRSFASPIGLAKYPEQLGTAPWEKWILFEVRSGRHIARDGFVAESDINIDRTVASVALYLPASALKSQTSIEYTDISMGATAGQALENMFQQGNTSIPNTGSGGGILDKLKSGGSGALGAAAGFVQQTGFDALSKAAGAIGADVGTAETLLGGAVNPRTDSIFKSVGYRTHDFDFSLIPRTVTEANSIDKILNILHFYSLPSYGAGAVDSIKGVAGNFFIGYPYEFVITMFTQTTDGSHHINTIERSVLTNISVDHAGGDRVAFVNERNGTEYFPAATRLAITFKETRLLGRDSDKQGKNVIYRGQSNVQPDYLEDPNAGTSLGNSVVGGVGAVALVTSFAGGVIARAAAAATK
jgi:hypothetical protein